MISLLSFSIISAGVSLARRAVPSARFVAWHEIADRRDIRQRLRALAVVTASARSLPALMYSIDGGMVQTSAAPAPRTDRSAPARAAIRHMDHIDAGHHLEQFAGDMWLVVPLPTMPC